MAKKNPAPKAADPAAETVSVNDLVARLNKLEAWAKAAKERLPNLPDLPDPE